MKTGDVVLKVGWDGEINRQLFGIIVDVYPDPGKLKNPFGAPWMYEVLWSDGFIKKHETGTLRRIMANGTW